MKVLVTGGAGKLGAEVSKELLTRGHEVRAVDFDQPAIDGAVCLSMDMSRPENCDKVAAGVDCVAHLGAFHGKHLLRNNGTKSERDFFAANVAGTFYMLDAAVANGIRKFVWASSVVVYERGNWRIFGVYSLSKVVGEEMCQFYNTEHGLSVIALRFGTFGSEDFLRVGFGMLGTLVHGNMITTEEAVRLTIAAIENRTIDYGIYDAQTPLPFTPDDEWAYRSGRKVEILAKYWPQHKALIEKYAHLLPPAINTVRMGRTLRELNVSVEHDFGWFLEELERRDSSSG